MSGISVAMFIVWIILVETVKLKAEEDLQTQITQLKSQVKVLTDGLQQEKMKVSALQTHVNMLQLRYENDTNSQTESKDEVQRHGSSEILTSNRRHSRSADPDEVAFSAQLIHELNNVPLHTTVIFDLRIYSTDNSYDSSTGVFTCPTSGLYLFAVFIESNAVDTDAAVNLMWNGKPYMNVVSEISSEYDDDTGGNVILFPINKGDRVWVETYHNDNQSFYPGFTTFSGVLIHRH